MGYKRLASGSPHLVLEVTDAILEASKVRDSGHCMLAEAVKTAYPRATHVSVDLATIRFTDKDLNKRFVYLTPITAQEALIDFDQGVNLLPFTVHLRRAAMVVAVRTKKDAGREGKSKGKGSARLPMSPEVRPDGSNVPIVVGGKTPPIGPLSNVKASRKTGRIRAYGLRALKR